MYTSWENECIGRAQMIKPSKLQILLVTFAGIFQSEHAALRRHFPRAEDAGSQRLKSLSSPSRLIFRAFTVQFWAGDNANLVDCRSVMEGQKRQKQKESKSISSLIHHSIRSFKSDCSGNSEAFSKRASKSYLLSQSDLLERFLPFCMPTSPPE